ncbi:MAG: cytidylate kinase family protein, partial [Polyangiaceae bacterium]|nr:cytidylate kinase family protein [Polyangiaceae bacterium]
MAVITISRGSLSGGAKLAELIGKRLGYEVLSREVIVEAAKTYGVSQDRIESGLEQAPSLWSKFAGHAESYLLAVQATLAELVEGGDAVYHGHGGSFLLGGLPGVLKVRLIAPLSYRVESAIAQLGLTHQQAAAHIQEIDRQRGKWVKSLYAEDWGDPSHYDIVLNVGDMSLETASEIVACVASRKEYEWTPETATVVRDFAIKNRVRAHLRFRSHYPEVVVNVQVHKSVVRLSGDAAFEAAKTEIAQFVRTIAGVERVAFERD